jgi:hypothetical protein
MQKFKKKKKKKKNRNDQGQVADAIDYCQGSKEQNAK